MKDSPKSQVALSKAEAAELQKKVELSKRAYILISLDLLKKNMLKKQKKLPYPKTWKKN